MTTPSEQAPIACTLSSGDLKDRLERTAQLAQRHLLSQHREGTRFRLLYAPQALAELRSIVALERECCAFLQFELTERSTVVELTITAPKGAGEFADVLFESFSAPAAVAVAVAVAPRCSTSCSCRVLA